MTNQRMRGAAAGAVFIYLSVVLVGCGEAEPTAQQEIVEMAADYPAYTSIEQLTDNASLIIEGTIQGTRDEMMYPTFEGDDPVENPYAGTNSRPSAEEIESMGIPVTVATVLVTKVYAGDATPGETVEIKQMGGSQDGIQYVLKDVQKVVVNASNLFFLEQYDEAPASILGGDDGLFSKTADGLFKSSTVSVKLSDLEKLL